MLSGFLVDYCLIGNLYPYSWITNELYQMFPEFTCYANDNRNQHHHATTIIIIMLLLAVVLLLLLLFFYLFT